MALGFLLATLLLAMVLSAAPPAGAAVPAGKAFAWGDNDSGQLGNGASGAGTESDVPVAVKNLSNVKNIDGGGYHTLAATQ
jgi:hypothetical protein